MDELTFGNLPEVEIYSVGPEQVNQVAPLLTDEAIELIKADEAFAMAIVEEDEIRGALCGRLNSQNDAVFDIISLYVAPDYRRRRLASTMLVQTIDILTAMTDGGVRWVDVSFDPRNEGIKEMLEANGFGFEEIDNTYCFSATIDNLKSSELMNYKIPSSGVLRRLSELSDYDIKQLLARLRENMIDYVSLTEIKEAMGDISHVLYDASGDVVACAIFSRYDDTTVTLSQFFTMNKSNGAMEVLRAGAEALIKNMPANTVLEIPTVSDSSEKLVKKLIPECTNVQIIAGMLEIGGIVAEDDSDEAILEEDEEIQ